MEGASRWLASSNRPAADQIDAFPAPSEVSRFLVRLGNRPGQPPTQGHFPPTSHPPVAPSKLPLPNELLGTNASFGSTSATTNHLIAASCNHSLTVCLVLRRRRRRLCRTAARDLLARAHSLIHGLSATTSSVESPVCWREHSFWITASAEAPASRQRRHRL